MHTNLRRYAFCGLSLCAGLLALLACGAGPPGPTPFPTLRPTPTPMALPEFLFSVFPEPGTTNEKGDLLFWGAVLNLPEIAIPGETLEPTDLQTRTQFLLDDHLITVALAIDYERPEVGASVWAMGSPSVGEHRVAIRVCRTSGEILEFSWSFSVDVYTFILPGLPEGFQFVRPLPDSTITLQDYQEEDLVPREYIPPFMGKVRGVCYGILASMIVEPGEVMPDVDEKAHFVALDGEPPGPDAEIWYGSDLGLHEFYDETGQVITSYGGQQHYKCWRADLAPGRHEATVRIERASGQVTEFTWWFVITE